MDEIWPLINEYVKLISQDHHKSKDGYFMIEVIWNAWDGKLTYEARHNGYCDEIRTPKARNSFAEALADLEAFLKEAIRTQKEFLAEKE